MTIRGTEFKITRQAIDDDARRILMAIDSSALCVKDISNHLDIPITKCYCLIRLMEKMGRLRQMEDQGLGVSTYRSNLHIIDLRIEHDRLNIDMEFTDGGKRTFEFCHA